MNNIYLEKTFNEIGRIISLLDRNAASPTYGCFDRRYWNWRIGDMPNASLQYGIYGIAWLYKNDTSGKYKANENLLEWIIAGLSYWARIQNKNGSFNQFFPNEQSVGTTYYTLSAALYAYETVAQDLEQTKRHMIENAICKASNFILKNNETYGIISNHISLFAHVNYKLAVFLKDDRFNERGCSMLETIFKNQSPEGWFLEYDGADPGYQTQCVYYLAECYKLTNNKIILEKLKHSIEDFLIYFFHPDGSFGGEYGSRNTQIVYPAGFEMLKDEIAICCDISDFIKEGIKTSKIISLNCFDDENLIRLSNNYLIASTYQGNDARYQKFTLPFSAVKIEKNFEAAGIAVRGNDTYYAITNFKKGGLIKVFDKRTKALHHEDNGYFFKIGKSVVSNQMIQNGRLHIGANEIECETDCYKSLNKMLTPLTNILLRICAASFFKSMTIANLFRKFLVKQAFTGRKKVGIHIKRMIRYSKNAIYIQDHISKNKGLNINEIISGRKTFAVKMASSNYHSDNDLVAIDKQKLDLSNLNKENKISITTSINLK